MVKQREDETPADSETDLAADIETSWPGDWERPRRFIYDEREGPPDRGPATDYLATATLFRRSYIKTIGRSAGQPVDARMAWYLGGNFGYFKLDSSCHSENLRTLEDYQADRIDGIVIDLILAGQHFERVAGTATFHFEIGDLTMTQTNVSALSRSDNAKVSSLFLPRSRLVAETGSDFTDPAFHIRSLSGAHLAPLAAAQLRELYYLHQRIPSEAFEVAVEATITVLLDILREEVRKSVDAVIATPLAAAMEFIAAHCTDPALTPERVAQALGTSRTRLYKLFAQRSLSVATHIRDLRLQRFIAELRETTDAGIGRLAWRCGFDMGAPEFAKLFKKAYGMAPREARLALTKGKSLIVRSRDP